MQLPAALSPAEVLSKEERERGLSRIVLDGLATHAMVTLTSGIFLVGYALELGASNLAIGILAAIPPLAALAQLPSVLLINRIRNRRLICLVTSGCSRLSWALIALLPFFFSPHSTVGMLILLLAVYSIVSSIGRCSWNSWMRDLVPREILGSFFSRRWSIAMAFGIPLSLASGYFIDLWKKAHPESAISAYFIVFMVGVAAGILGLFFLAGIPEPGMQTPQAGTFRALLENACSNSNLRNLLCFLGLWNFAVNLAAPFFTVYLLRFIGLDMATVTLLAVISQVISVLSYPFWGSVIDRYGNKPTLYISGPLFMCCLIGWTFTTMPGPHPFTLPLLVLLHAIMGISTAGVVLSSGYIGMKLAEPREATAQLAVIGVINSIFAGIAPVIGGLFVDLFLAQELTWTLAWRYHDQILAIQTLSLQGWDFFFVFAFIIGLFSILRLRQVQEEGEVASATAMQDLLMQVRREMRNLSTVGGLRYLLHIPVTATIPEREDGDRMSSLYTQA